MRCGLATYRCDWISKVGMPKLHEHAIDVPYLTDAQRTRQALGFYNPGPKRREYQLDATYAPTALDRPCGALSC